MAVQQLVVKIVLFLQNPTAPAVSVPVLACIVVSRFLRSSDWAALKVVNQEAEKAGLVLHRAVDRDQPVYISTTANIILFSEIILI